MNKEEAIKRLEEIKQEEAELQAIIDKPDRWQDLLVQPDKEKYFFIASSGRWGLTINSNSGIDRKSEYAFKTGAQAELIKEKMLLMQEMHAFAHVRNEGWLPDWGDKDEDEYKDEYKWGIIFSRNGDVYVDWQLLINRFIFGIAVKSEEIALDMLEEFGERIEAVYNKQY